MVFVDVASERDGGFGQAKWHLRGAVEALGIIENGTAPFLAERTRGAKGRLREGRVLI